MKKYKKGGKSRVNEAGNYTKPGMRKKIFQRIKAGSKGGNPGQWSARKAQMLAKAYKSAGGGYKQLGGEVIEDPDGEMVLGQLASIGDKVVELQDIINVNQELEPWVNKKITLADAYIDTVTDYLKYDPESANSMMQAKYGKELPKAQDGRKKFEKYLAKNNIPFWLADSMIRRVDRKHFIPADSRTGMSTFQDPNDHRSHDYIRVADPNPLMPRGTDEINNWLEKNQKGFIGSTSNHFENVDDVLLLNPNDRYYENAMLNNQYPMQHSTKKVYPWIWNNAEPGDFYHEALSNLKAYKKIDKKLNSKNKQKEGGMVMADKGMEFPVDPPAISYFNFNTPRPSVNLNLPKFERQRKPMFQSDLLRTNINLVDTPKAGLTVSNAVNVNPFNPMQSKLFNPSIRGRYNLGNTEFNAGIDFNSPRPEINVGLKKMFEYGGNLPKAQGGLRWNWEAPDSALENVLEVIDVTGLLTWDDLKRDQRDGVVDPFNVIGSLPAIGKLKHLKWLAPTRYFDLPRNLRRATRLRDFNRAERNKALARTALNVYDNAELALDVVDGVGDIYKDNINPIVTKESFKQPDNPLFYRPQTNDEINFQQELDRLNFFKRKKGGYTVTRSSDRKGKTHKVTGPDGSVKYFGDPNMGERSKSKYGKEAFYKRHAKNLKKNPHFRAYARATWRDGGKLNIDPYNVKQYVVGPQAMAPSAPIRLPISYLSGMEPDERMMDSFYYRGMEPDERLRPASSYMNYKYGGKLNNSFFR